MSGARRFDVREELGKGAFGSVYLAEMTSASGFSKTVALKILHGAWAQRADATRRLRDEARLLGRLRHPNIVAVDDLLRVDGQWAVVMEHVAGQDLEQVLLDARRAGRMLPLGVVAGIIECVARALDAAWSGMDAEGRALRVVHRDIKPSNVRVTPEGVVKVLDFGIAATRGEGAEGSQGTQRMGSPAYMSPERVTGEDDGPAGDVYALGATLLELLSGVAVGRCSLNRDTHAARVDELAGQVRHTRGAEAEPLLALASACLAYTPAERPDAARVASEARAYARAAADDLVPWAREHVAARRRVGSDGFTLGETTSGGNATLALDGMTTVFPDVLVEESTGDGHPFDAPVTPPAAVTAPLVATSSAVSPAVRGRGLLVGAILGLALAVGGALFVTREEAAQPPSGDPPTSTSVADVVTSSSSTPVPADAPVPLASGPVSPVPSPQAPPAQVEPLAPASSPVRAPPLARPTSANMRPASSVTNAVALPAPAAPSVVTVRSVKVVVAGARVVRARCGDVEVEGGTSASLRNVPAGACTVRAGFEDTTLTATVQVDTPRVVQCTREGGALTCS